MNKVAWITGASRGIGLETAASFLELNWTVVVLTRNTAPLSALKAVYKDQLHVIGWDLEAALTAERTALLPQLPVDVLINNAGALVNEPFEKITRSALERVYAVNVFAPFQLVQALLPQFSSTAHVVNISSVGGVQGSVKFPGLTAYSSSKGALNVLTECLQAEFESTGYAFNALALGAVQTEMLEEAFPGFKAPLQPNEMAQYIVQFATTAHRYLKGKVISVSTTTP